MGEKKVKEVTTEGLIQQMKNKLQKRLETEGDLDLDLRIRFMSFLVHSITELSKGLNEDRID